MRFLLFFLAIFCGGCVSKKEETKSYLSLTTPWQQEASHIQRLIEKGNLEEASMRTNIALNKFPDQPSLHLLNGLIYERLSSNGYGENLQMAETAYHTALNIDAHDWYANYCLGRLYLQKGEYRKAQRAFLSSVKARPKDARVLYNLGFASYYAGDIPCAYVSLRKGLSLLKDGSAQYPLYLRGVALVSAALGLERDAQKYLALLQKRNISLESEDLLRLKRRIESWKQWSQVKLHRANFSREAAAQNADSGAEGESEAETTEPQEPEDRVIIFDCMLINLNEEVDTRKGQNVLENFTKNILMTVAGKKDTIMRRMDEGLFGGPSHITKTFKFDVTPGTIAYHANIMNTAFNKVELIARPTLSTFLGSPTRFNSGQQVTGGIVGSSGGNLINIPVGTVVNITPLKIDGDQVSLSITAESSFFVKRRNANSGLSQATLDVARTKIETLLQLKFNETAMIGGNYEREFGSDRSGVPFLGRIPFFQYFFSRQTQKFCKRSILFLITPRRRKPAFTQLSKSIAGNKCLKPFPEAEAFVKQNNGFSEEVSSRRLLYNDVYKEINNCHRGDLIRMHEEDPLGYAWILRSFLYY